jgi:hypothetical protein
MTATAKRVMVPSIHAPSIANIAAGVSCGSIGVYRLNLNGVNRVYRFSFCHHGRAAFNFLSSLALRSWVSRLSCSARSLSRVAKRRSSLSGGGFMVFIGLIS